MSRMIIDSHNHIINHREPVWGWGPRYTVEQLVAALDLDYDVMGEVRHISKAVVMGSLGRTALGDYSFEEAHAYVFESIKKFPDRLYMNPVFNPRIWKADELNKVDGWVKEYNVCMLKIHPTMHNYLLPMFNPYPGDATRKMVYPVFEKARQLGVPVMIHMGEPPHSNPSSVDPIAEQFPDVPIIIAHSGANNTTSYALSATVVARHHENVFLGTSWVQPQDLSEMYYAVGPSKIIFESDCAPQSIGQQMRQVINLHLPPPLGVGASADDVYCMIGGNIAQLCKIPVQAESAPADHRRIPV
jgi:predicted TIM-barrel fold metal-dependent hydrolase